MYYHWKRGVSGLVAWQFVMYLVQRVCQWMADILPSPRLLCLECCFLDTGGLVWARPVRIGRLTFLSLIRSLVLWYILVSTCIKTLELSLLLSELPGR